VIDGNVSSTTTTSTATGYLFDDLAPGHDYSVRFDLPGGYVFTFPNRGDDNATDSDALSDGSINESTGVTVSGDSNLTFDAGVYRPASLGDRIWLDLDADGVQDPGESNFTGQVTVTLYDENNQSVTDASGNPVNPVTTTNGSYRFDNLVPGTYHVCFTLPNGAYFSPGDQGSDDALDSDADAATGCTADTTLASGDNDPDWDAGVYELAALGDKVWIDTNGNGIQDENDVPTDFNVTVELYSDSNNSLVATQVIEPSDNGAYLFEDLHPGPYHVKFVLPANSPYVFTVADQGNDDAEDSDANAGGTTPSEFLSSGEENRTIDAGLYIPASLGDRVWFDADADGVQDPGEENISDLNVTLYDEDGNTVAHTTTDADGVYHFYGLQPGTYRVSFALEDGEGNHYRVSPQHSGDANASTDNDANATGWTDPVTLSSGEHNPTVDAGLFIPVSVGDFVWSDANGDGIQNDGNASGIPDVNVTLFRIDEQGDAVPVASTLTDATGRYLFEGLNPGEYFVRFIEPAHYRTTTPDAGGDDALDSDANRSTGETARFVLVSPDDNLTLDAGYYALAVIEGNVTEDLDNNDSGDVGLADVNITLLDADGNLIAWTLTDANGSYRFVDLEPGNYLVREIQPDGYLDVSENEGGDDNDTGNDTPDNTIAVTVGIGEVDTGNDFVEEKDASIGDYVWVDMNKNGLQDPGESGLADVNVTLYNDQNESLGWTLTDADGRYLFDGLPEGDYYVEFNLTQLAQTYDDLYRVTDRDVGSDDQNDSDANRTTGRTAPTHLLPGEDDLSWDMGVYPLATIRGNVSERDANGEYHPMADVEIQLLYPDGTPVLDEYGQPVTTRTDADGNYVFEGVEPGEYIVREVQPEGYYDVSENEGGEDNDTVAGAGENEIGVIVEPGENDTGNDFVEEQAAILGDRVWYDADHNGIQDANESGMEGIGVCLLDANGDPVLDENNRSICTETNSTGEYRFDNLDPEFDYAVEFNLSDLPTEYHEPTLRDQGGDEALDSDANDQGITDPVDLVPGEFYRDLDMGVWAPFAHVGDKVWYDDNHNGIQDPGEDPVEGVTVEIFDANGSPAYDGLTGAHSVVTDENGSYGFDVLPGDYELRFTLPDDLVEDGYGFTRSRAGEDQEDSDVNGAGITRLVHLEPGDNVVTLDAGVACTCGGGGASGDGGSAMGRWSGLLMILLTMGLGWLAVRRQEEMMRKEKR
jgi:protocatechuate 3,4-dioxygenase beta subunit